MTDDVTLARADRIAMVNRSLALNVPFNECDARLDSVNCNRKVVEATKHLSNVGNSSIDAAVKCLNQRSIDRLDRSKASDSLNRWEETFSWRRRRSGRRRR